MTNLAVDTSIYIGPKIVTCGRYVLGLEQLKDMQPEIEKLHRDHFKETETRYLGDAEADPDYEYVLLMEEQNRALFFTVRDSEDNYKMVGNAMFFIGQNLPMKDKTHATEITFYLTKEHRDKGLAFTWMKFIKESLLSFGMDYIWMSDRAPSGGKSLAELLDGHGFKPVATTYVFLSTPSVEE